MHNEKSVTKITNAFFELICEKDYSEITVTDIVKRAGVSRMAFYRNFHSKQDIANGFIKGIIDETEITVNRIKSFRNLKEYFIVIFLALAKYNNEIKAFYKANLGELMLSHCNVHLFKTPMKNKLFKFDKYQSKFLSGAFYNVFVEWVITDMKESAEKMATICSTLFSKSIVKEEQI